MYAKPLKMLNIKKKMFVLTLKAQNISDEQESVRHCLNSGLELTECEGGFCFVTCF